MAPCSPVSQQTATKIADDVDRAPRRVVYATSDRLTALADRLPSNPGRSRQVHELVRALGLLNESGEDALKARVIEPATVDRKDLARFHSEDFVGRSSTAHPPSFRLRSNTRADRVLYSLTKISFSPSMHRQRIIDVRDRLRLLLPRALSIQTTRETMAAQREHTSVGDYRLAAALVMLNTALSMTHLPSMGWLSIASKSLVDPWLQLGRCARVGQTSAFAGTAADIMQSGRHALVSRFDARSV